MNIIGSDNGKIVAAEKFSDPRKAEQVASYWRSSGLLVATQEAAVIETDQPKEAKAGRVISQPSTSARFLGHPGEPLAGYFTPHRQKSQ